MVKIGSVRAEIFLIWTNVAKTNVAKTNVAKTNVIMTNGIYSRCSQEPFFKIGPVTAEKSFW